MKHFKLGLTLALTIGLIGILAACASQPTPAASMTMGDDASQNGEMSMENESEESGMEMDMNATQDPAATMQMDMKMDMPADLDTSTTVTSELGIFKVSYTSSQNAEAINEIFNWTIHVENADGAPVDNAEISIQTLMPQHGHGMPTDPQITQNLGNGDYKLEGLKYSMPGWWEETLTITANNQTDVATFNQVLK